MHVERLGDLGEPAAVLRRVAAATDRLGVPPPAALIGDWFGSRAVLAPSVAIRAVAPEAAFATPAGAGGPAVHGGWIGFLSYPDPGRDGAPHRAAPAAGGWTERVLRCDADGCWHHESLDDTPCPPWLTEALRRTEVPRPWHIGWQPPDRTAHRAGVQACLAAIRAGEIYQACVCTRFTGELSGRPVDFFADTVAALAPSRAAFVAGDHGALASLSPELFLRRHADTVTSSPIKGTVARSASPTALMASVKDVAENIMIVDLVRNDLGRVARIGSVTVPELLQVRPAPGVWHLVSTVTAQLDHHTSTPQLLAATFPPASVTGTPKGRARRLLSGWEPHRRGAYCGAIGMVSPVAGCELNVAIRTVEFDAAGSAVLGVGGGITADSDPDAEWQECLDKAAAIMAAGSTGHGWRPPRRRARGATAHPGAGRSPVGRRP